MGQPVSRNPKKSQPVPKQFSKYLLENWKVLLIGPVVFTVAWILLGFMLDAVKGRELQFSVIWSLVVPFFGCLLLLFLVFLGTHREEKKKGNVR